MDRIRIGRKVVKVGDLIGYSKGVGEVLAITIDETEAKPIRSSARINVMGKIIKIKDAKELYKRNTQGGFNKFDLEVK